MPYKPIEIDRKNLTIMGVAFPDLNTLNSAANAIGSNMFEGFEPTRQLVEIYRDYRSGKIPQNKLLDLLRAAV
jgi:putative transcriptional regulator